MMIEKLLSFVLRFRSSLQGLSTNNDRVCDEQCKQAKY
jgi:hypothetical protein